MPQTLERVNEVFRDLFDDDDLTVAPETTAADVAGWDSLMHVRLMLAIEKQFGVKFLSSEVSSLKSVADLHRARPGEIQGLTSSGNGGPSA